uniref:Uncharacterized protein n=1 Tax=Chionoecetes opilio bacilliform virus TaxID=1825681 RepID=A0A1Q3DKS3_9VIRU|nr:wsv390-like protein [Chionoecetes opilio bacilliform virus]GAV93127.1 hypothetical protein SCV_002 [Chionoecetes opilio bacilliform virus]
MVEYQDANFPILGICADEKWCKKMKTYTLKKMNKRKKYDKYHRVFSKINFMESCDIRVYESTITFIKRSDVSPDMLERLNFGININNGKNKNEIAVIYIHSAEENKIIFDGYGIQPTTCELLTTREDLGPFLIPKIEDVISHHGHVDFTIVLTQVDEYEHASCIKKINNIFGHLQVQFRPTTPIAIYNIIMLVLDDDAS